MAKPAPSKRNLYLAGGLLSLWLVFLFVGATLGGLVHLALLGVLWLRPWQLPAQPTLSPSAADRSEAEPADQVDEAR